MAGFLEAGAFRLDQFAEHVERPLDFAARLALSQSLPLVVALLAVGQGNLDLLAGREGAVVRSQGRRLS